jgi:hypothetical protein
MSESGSGAPKAGENTGSFSPEYIKELREEAASWRTKFRETETKFTELSEKMSKTEQVSKIKQELDALGVKADPSWVKVDQGMSPSDAVNKFLEEYPHLGPASNGENTPSQKPPTRKPMRTEGKNSNIPNTNDAEYSSVKKDPIARTKLREIYRAMLSDGGLSI